MAHVGEQLVERLIAYGIDQVFGCPGGQSLPLYNGIAQHPGEITHTLMHDERSGVYAADGYARASGKVGVCDATVGPGATNLVSGLIEAYSSSIPVLAIVSDIPRRWEHRRDFGGASQGFHQHDFLEGCVKYLGRVEQAENLAEMLEACLRIATAGRPGPVILEIPDDVYAGDSATPTFAPQASYGHLPCLRAGTDPEATAEAVALIEAAERPIIIAGGGAIYSGACDAVRALAEALKCPVATTLSGKGTIPETHPLSVGVVGRFGIPMANAIFAAADLTIFIGSKAGQGVTLDYGMPGANSPVIHIDIDASEIGRNFHNTVGLFADARLGADALLAAIRDKTLRSSWDASRFRTLQHEWWDGDIEYQATPVEGTVKPQAMVRIMSTLMSEGDTLVTDVSLSSGWGAGRWRAKASGGYYFAPPGLAGLGWGLPAAIGVASARRNGGREGRIVMLAGDGGWAYSLAEVETAARAGLPIISVLLNNSTLGWIKHVAETRYPAAMVSQDFSAVNYADAATALGVHGEHVDNIADFESLFKSALADESGRPWVIEASSCPIESPVQRGMPTPASTKGGY